MRFPHPIESWIRLDAGTASTGTVITPYYDSLLVKVSAKGQSPVEAKQRMDRALREFRVRGVKTNIPFLLKLINHSGFDKFDYHTKFIDSEKSLFEFSGRKDRASKTLNFLAEVIVNGIPRLLIDLNYVKQFQQNYLTLV